MKILKNIKYYQRGSGVTSAAYDISICEGVIAEIALTGDGDYASDCSVYDMTGYVLFPGLVDLHVHLREPGFEYKETIASGTKAAARGGMTTIFSMPNLSPVPDSLEGIGVQLDAIRDDAVVKVVPYGSITRGQRGAGELVDFVALAPFVGGFSDDGRGVQSGELMGEAMRAAAEVGRAIVAHCEVDDLLRGGYIHDGDYAKENGHRGICSQSEWEQIARDIELVEGSDIEVQYHVCHISTKESVEIIRQAKSRGVMVSCETAPHYLLLTDKDLKEEGRFKMNPPIRSAQDRAALIEGIKDGTIDAIATDHAPHSAEEKSRGLEKSAFGVVGIEFSFATMYRHFVLTGIITLDRLIDLMSTRPRELFKLGGGVIEVGAEADIVVIDLEHRYTIDSSEFVSKGKATPLEGIEVQGRTKMTMVSGEIAYME